MNRNATWAIAEKDITDSFRNAYLVFAIGLPLALSLLFTFFFRDDSAAMTLKMRVYDPGGSRLVADLAQQGGVEINRVESAAEAQAISAPDSVGALILPPDFDAAVAAGEQPELTVVVNGSAGGGALAAFQRLVEQAVWQQAGIAPPARLRVIDAAQTGSGSGVSSLNAFFLVMLLLITLAMLGTFYIPILLVEEKERHTLLSLQVSPAGPLDIVLGKSFAGLFYAALTIAIILTLNDGWRGQWTITLFGVILGTLFVILLGLLLGRFFNTTRQVNTWSSVVMLLLLLPGMAPALALPEAALNAARVAPTYHLGELVLNSVTGRSNWAQAAPQLGFLALSVAVVLALAVWRLRRQPNI